MTPPICVLILLLAQPADATRSAAELLERAIYAEETQGDLQTAIDIYARIADGADADRPIAARALFRLAMCYAKSGRQQEANAKFRLLESHYPEQRELLARIPRARAGALPLAPERWDRDEVFVLRGRVGTGEIFRVTRGAADDVRRCEHYFMYGFFAADVSANDMSPRSGAYEYLLGGGGHRAGHRGTLTYRDGQVEITHTDRSGTSTRQLTTSSVAYDAASLPQLIRRLPLADGFHLEIPLVDANRGVHKAVVEVRGREELTVPAGTFDTYKVSVAYGHLDEDLYWYSADARRLIVRKGDARLTHYLDHHGGTHTVADDSLSARLTLPADWLLLDDGSSRIQAHAFAPGMTAFASILHLPAHPREGVGSPKDMAKAWMAEMARRAPSTFRPQDPEHFEINGATAARYVVDWGETMGYWVYVAHGDDRLRLWFDFRKERWAALKPVLDEITASLVVEGRQP